MTNETVEVLEPWREISLDSISARTQMGQAVKLALKHGWVVKAARTVSKVHERELKNGKRIQPKIEEHFWIGGAKPNLDKPTKVFRINKFYMKKNAEFCDFPELKQFILEN